MSASQQSYSVWMLRLHWLTVLLLIAVYASIEFRGVFEKGTMERDLIKEVHFVLGLSLWCITWLRLLVKRFSFIPLIKPAPKTIVIKIAALMHAVLYVFLLLMPILGYLLLSAADHVIPFWGFQLPALITPDPDLAASIKEVHEMVGKAGYAFIALHVLGALAHHYIVKDNTLKRMLPGLFGTKS
ncbi:cytochrome b [Rheinheimera sp. 1928-s]|uniref:cytochrome b n=1 Tax=Rheinheimera sp. 1928-s TaxID=3033803 RepID=UPI002616E59C|nr:cytochrome b [Rheinheimera sp. 1928-s]MDF3126445.1 cytochrome b [Rheinheimera sp. 1928-s]